MRRAKQQLYQRIKLYDWLRWQCLKRSKKYRNATAALLRTARQQSRITPIDPSNTSAKETYAALLKVYREARAPFRGFTSEKLARLERGFWTIHVGRNQKVGSTALFYLRRRFHIWRKIRDYLMHERIPPELTAFQRSFRMNFPLSPSIPICIEKCHETELPSVARYNQARDELTVKVFLVGPKQALRGRLNRVASLHHVRHGYVCNHSYESATGYLNFTIRISPSGPSLEEQFKALLGECLPPRWPRLADRRYYERCVQVYDLKREGFSWDKIVKSVYPDDTEERGGSYDSALAKAKQHYHLIEELMEAFESPANPAKGPKIP